MPLLAGGGLYETGAGGSAPKHAQQLAEEGHLRWDSLGEFLALSVSLEDLGHKSENPKALILASALNDATGKFLDHDRSPHRKVGEVDNRGSHFYLATYWAECLAAQDEDAELKAIFTKLASELGEKRSIIVNELSHAQGQAVDLGGYYHLNRDKVERIMRPSQTLNSIIDAV